MQHSLSLLAFANERTLQMINNHQPPPPMAATSPGEVHIYGWHHSQLVTNGGDRPASQRGYQPRVPQDDGRAVPSPRQQIAPLPATVPIHCPIYYDRPERGVYGGTMTADAADRAWPQSQAAAFSHRQAQLQAAHRSAAASPYAPSSRQHSRVPSVYDLGAANVDNLDVRTFHRMDNSANDPLLTSDYAAAAVDSQVNRYNNNAINMAASMALRVNEFGALSPIARELLPEAKVLVTVREFNGTFNLYSNSYGVSILFMPSLTRVFQSVFHGDLSALVDVPAAFLTVVCHPFVSPSTR